MDHAPSNHSASSSNGSLVAQADDIERRVLQSYHPPSTAPPSKQVQYVYNPEDGSVLLDHKGRPVSVDRLLATKPLRGEVCTRPGPGNKKLTYLSGDGVTRTLNDVFGWDGWNLDIVRTQREECIKDKDKYTVVCTAMVRVTHRASGSYREDCGAGDSTDRCFATAVANALKASVTDALKRAARHFGDKLGNSLYQGNFTINKAPVSLKDALDKYDIERANAKFGFAKDQVTAPMTTSSTTTSANSTSSSTTVSTAAVSSRPAVVASNLTLAQSSVQKNPPVSHPGAPTSVNVAAAPGNARILPLGSSNIPFQPAVNRSSSSINPAATVGRAPQIVPRAAVNRQSNNIQTTPCTGTSTSNNANATMVAPNTQESGSTAPRQQADPPRPSYPSRPVNSLTAATPVSSYQCSTTTSQTAPPPPTPMDMLRNSALFHTSEFDLADFADDLEEEHRPKSSRGHHSNPRNSIGNGLPIQPPPLVTPTINSNTNKRPALESISNMDPTLTKRMTASNPYCSNNNAGISRLS